MLVLAIAGLIFLIVFLAVPALQRSQRDTQRRTDTGRLLTYLSNYQSNNRGALPDVAATQTLFKTNYAKELNSPSTGTAYTINFAVIANTDVNTIQIGVANKCSGDAFLATGATARNVAVRLPLEGGGAYCTDQ